MTLITRYGAGKVSPLLLSQSVAAPPNPSIRSIAIWLVISRSSKRVATLSRGSAIPCTESRAIPSHLPTAVLTAAPFPPSYLRPNHTRQTITTLRSTLTSSSGLKTRHFGTIISEITSCLRIHSACNSRLGGVSLEFTGELNDEGFSVTECLGGSMELSEEQLGLRYQVRGSIRYKRLMTYLCLGFSPSATRDSISSRASVCLPAFWRTTAVYSLDCDQTSRSLSRTISKRNAAGNHGVIPPTCSTLSSVAVPLRRSRCTRKKGNGKRTTPETY